MKSFHEKKRHQNTQKTGISKNYFYKSYVFLKIFSSEFQQLTKKDKKNL